MSKDLFSLDENDTLSFLDEKKKSSASDGLYRVDFSKITDKQKGYTLTVRFLPNFLKEPIEINGEETRIGSSSYTKIRHYVDLKNIPGLAGYYDSPKNFGEKCSLTDLYYLLDKSTNAILKEKAKLLKYSKKYYSYIMVMADENHPENVGKIMILEYGKTIFDLIKDQKDGVDGTACDVFNLHHGKNLVLRVKEVTSGGQTYPDYKSSFFKGEACPISIMVKGELKALPIENGKIPSKYLPKVEEMFLNREHDLEEFQAKKLTDEQQSKITDIVNYLSGRATLGFEGRKTAQPAADDFNVTEDIISSEIPPTAKKVASSKSDDFFDDLTS
jgi:hypothetical protein